MHVDILKNYRNIYVKVGFNFNLKRWNTWYRNYKKKQNFKSHFKFFN